MTHEKLTPFINAARQKGQSDEFILQKLTFAGWDQKTVMSALIEDDVPRPDKPTSKYAHTFWDAFEHILLFISLYVVAISFSMILHTFVDQYLPATTADDYYRYNDNSWRNSETNGYLSALLVAFPIFALLFRRITRRTLQNQSLRREIARRILTYGTLVGTFLILLYKASTTVYTLLMGNLTLNFILHFIITTTVSGLIFAYYFNEVKEDRQALKEYEKA